MKTRIYLLAIVVILSVATLGTRSYAATAVTSENTIANAERIPQMKLRLEEIKNTDKSVLTKEGRKELRNEVKVIRHEAQAMRGGVYLAVGAILVIILILILIL